MSREIRDKCPFCGGTRGLYSKYSLHGLRRYYDFSGSCEDNMDLAYQQGGKRLYCQNCDKYVCNVDELADIE